MGDPDCGGCKGLGAHRRWCPEVIGRRASFLGKLSDEAEDLGDTIGANQPEAANACYQASGLLLAAAREAADAFSLRRIARMEGRMEGEKL